MRALLALAMLLAPAVASGEVVRVVVEHRAPFLGGLTFGEVGAYEVLSGRIFIALDPEEPANAAIVDLRLAPRGADGRVQIEAAFVVLQPVDPQHRRGVAWVDLGAGGPAGAFALLHGATRVSAAPEDEAELGDPLLLREGLTVVSVAWRTTPGPGGLSLDVPIAREPDGAPVMGWVRDDWVVEEDVARLPLSGSGGVAYPPVVPEAPVHVLTVRDTREGPRDTVPRERWRFVEAAPTRGVPAGIERSGGFDAGKIYELTYRAQDPRVVGVGLAVIRDVMSYSLYDLRSVFPTRRGIAFGAGSGGRALRQFLREGFNVDEDGRRVFDGVWVHGAGAGRGSFNARFAQPDRSPAAFRDFLHPVDLFPFTHSTQFDPVTGLDEGLLDRIPEDRVPRTLTTHTGYDYWARAAALTHTSVDGLRDVGPTADHRAFHLASTAPSDLAPAAAADPRPTLRALAVGMVRWITDDRPLPPSRIPSVGEGSLVPSAGVAYPGGPAIPTPPRAHLAYRADYGPRFRQRGIIDRDPPEVGVAFPALVPQVDGIGNELGGVRGLETRVPLATHLPWDVRDAAPFEGEARPDRGRIVPLPVTDERARVAEDPRPSLQRLYGSEAVFLARVRAAAAALVEEGFLLEIDREGAIAAARARWLRTTSR